ncbi:MAG: Peptidase protein [Patescibacteria group bacterium]|nr:Peptidase protein [Patescibacteria group bacterium]
MNNQFRHPKAITRLIIATTSAFLLLLIIIFAYPAWQKHNIELEKQALAQVTPPPKIFPSVMVEAKSAIVMEANTGKIIYNKNGNDKLPLASITKLMTAYTASQVLGGNDAVKISASALSGGSNAGLLVEDIWSVNNLIDYMLTTSANGAASALAETANARGFNFVTLMNDNASKIGLTTTQYINETGLDLGYNYGGSYGSAHDTAKLMRYIIKNKPQLLQTTVRPSILTSSTSGLVYAGNNTNDIVGKIPGLIASKTGYTDSAGGNLVVALDAGLAQPVIVVVLGSSKDGRFTDVLALAKATVTYYSE